ncbi:hypothetical protein [Arthrobacter sp. Br18]|uniref:hypothetical protein n=1 Tax=Arthrobacter sp. Br18 TaxID=1312954 RepID=UPI0004B82130
MAASIGCHLNTLRTVVYEWSFNAARKPTHEPALMIEPVVTGKPLTEVLST